MANAGFGLPQPYTIAAVIGTTEVRPASNLLNDEPGLVFESQIVPNNGELSIDFNFTGPLSFLCLLGLNALCQVTLLSYASAADRAASTAQTVVFAYSGPSINKSSTNFKNFHTFSPTSAVFYRLRIKNVSGINTALNFWRLLMGRWVEPADNIEVQAKASIDDRSARRYSSTGRRNFTKYGVYPAFSGKWPWISDTEYKTMIRPMMLQYGASKPVLFCLDYAESTWGQDGLYYGDLERDQSIVLDDGQLYSYSFTIVDIAPVDLTA